MKTITKDTLVPLGLAAGIAGLIFLVGTNYQRINQTLEEYGKSQDQVMARLVTLDEKLTSNTQAIAELKKELVPPSGSAMSTEPPDEPAGSRRYFYTCGTSPAGWRLDSKCRLYKL